MTQKIRKIFWALDAFEPPGEILNRTKAAIRSLADRFPGATIEPIFVLSPGQLNLATEFSSPWLAQYRSSARQALENLVKDIKAPGLLPPRILMRNVSATGAVVKALSDYAFSAGADLIVASTHGRSGFSRLILGSFSETLLYRSRVPVLVVSPRMSRKFTFDHVLFPTDFGPYSRNNFRYVVEMARGLNARLTLFHSVPHPIDPILQSGVYLLGGSWIPMRAYFGEEVRRRTRHGDRWVAWAKSQGVPSELIIDSIGVPVSETLINIVRQKSVSVVMMEAHSGPVTAALIGSITRQVLHHVDCPVWVMHPMQPTSAAARGGPAPLPRAA